MASNARTSTRNKLAMAGKQTAPSSKTQRDAALHETPESSRSARRTPMASNVRTSTRNKLAMAGKQTAPSSEAQQNAILPETPESSRTDPRSPDHHTCPTCTQTIVEATDDAEGQEALICEGNCNAWYHRWCAGVSTLRYESLSSSEEPFLCPSCTADRHQQSILELQSNVKSLSDEVRELKAIIATLQKSNMDKNSNPTPNSIVPGPEGRTASEQWSVVTGRSRKGKGF